MSQSQNPLFLSINKTKQEMKDKNIQELQGPTRVPEPMWRGTPPTPDMQVLLFTVQKAPARF